VAADPPAFTSSATPAIASPGKNFVLRVSVTNTGDVDAHNVMVNLTLPAGFALAAGADPQNIGTVADGATVDAVWTVTAACAAGLHNISWSISSLSYNETFTANGNYNVSTNVTALALNTPLETDEIPRTFSFNIVANEWAAVGIRPDTADHDVSADTDLCLTSPYQVSAGIGLVRDFIVASGHSYAAGTHYAMAHFGTPSGYAMEWDQGFDLTVGIASLQSNSAFEVLDIYEANLTAGNKYVFRYNQTAGAMDAELFGYQAGRSDGDRFNSNWSGNRTGAGGDEYMLVCPNVNGVAAFVIVNANHNASNYTVGIAQVLCDGDMNFDGFVDGRDVDGFVDCILSGNNCEYSDVNDNCIPADDDLVGDTNAFVNKLLTDPNTACP